MSKLTRTPPNKSSSELNIVALDAPNEYSSDFTNKNRVKRARTNSSSGEELQDFKGEIKELLRVMKDDKGSNISKMLSEQTALMKNLASDVTKLKSQNEEIIKTNEGIQTSINFINQKYEEFKIEVDTLKKEKQQQINYIERLEKRINDLQYRSRTSSVEIRNVPYNEKETTTSLQNLVSNVGKLTNVPINQSDIRDVYRTGGKQAKQRPIIVEFARVEKKTALLSNIREYNKSKKTNSEKINTSILGIPGQCQPVYIAEHLPMTTKKLYHSARAFAKEFNYKFCLVVNGNIYIRKTEEDKQILITAESSLSDLKSSFK